MCNKNNSSETAASRKIGRSVAEAHGGGKLLQTHDYFLWDLHKVLGEALSLTYTGETRQTCQSYL